MLPPSQALTSPSPPEAEATAAEAPTVAATPEAVSTSRDATAAVERANRHRKPKHTTLPSPKPFSLCHTMHQANIMGVSIDVL